MIHKYLFENKEQQNIQSEYIQKTGTQAEEESRRVEDLEEKIRDCYGKKGKLESQIEVYSRQEEQFNTRYKEELVRNIVGAYEAGTLEIRHQIYEQELTRIVRERTESQKKLESEKEMIRSQERSLEDKKEHWFIKKQRSRDRQKYISFMRKNWKQGEIFLSIWTWKQDIFWIVTEFLMYQSES